MTAIQPSPIRQTVQARFGTTAYEGPTGTTLEAFIQEASPQVNGRIVAALKDGKLRELSHPLRHDAQIVPVTTAASDGTRIYRRSLSFLMIAAAAELWPGRTFTIHHSMPFGGYYCECDTAVPLTVAELKQLRQRMSALVAADLPIKQVRAPLDEALTTFRESNDPEKADLFSKRRKDYVTLYELNDVRDYFHGFMVPSTGYLEVFDLRAYHNGFILQFPRRHEPGILQSFEDEPILVKVFQEYKDWLKVMGVPRVASMNEVLQNGRLQEVILVAEALHQQQLADIGFDIHRKRPHVKLILISGPTSAGKDHF